MKELPFWSIIIPVYNETPRLGNLTHILDYLSRRRESWELIVVNDGSSDDTLSVLKKMNQGKKFTIVTYEKNNGKGYAVKRGMLAARGQYRLFLDMDLSTPIEEMERLTQEIKKYDCVIGTRKAKGAKVVVHQPWLREHLGKGFTFLSVIILGVPVSDFTCGFKCFTAKAAEKIFSQSRIYRWGFDSEILFLAFKYRFKVKEIPVTWTDDRRTRVKFPQDLITSLSELIRIRYYDLTGLYQTQV